MRKKKFEILSLVLILTLVAVGCNRKGDPKEGEPYLYYINEEEGPLVKKAYDWKGETPGRKWRIYWRALGIQRIRLSIILLCH